MAKSFEAAAKAVAAGGDDEGHAKLLAALKAEEMQAVGYETSAEVTQHTESLNRYFGKPYGDEVDGRSKITTREIYETTAWLVPDLLDIFAAGGRICELEADDPEAEHAQDCALLTGIMPMPQQPQGPPQGQQQPPPQQGQPQGQPGQPPQPPKLECTCGSSALEERADYLNYVFFKDNNGVLILHDFIFDCLMHPRGYSDIEWDKEPTYAGWQEYENLNEEEAMALLQDQTTEIDEESIEESQGEDGLPLVKLKARKRLRDGGVKIEVPPPEDMFVAGRSTDMQSARYKGRLLRWRRSVWKQNFPEMREQIEEYSAGDESTSIDTDERRQARFDDGQASHGEFATAANKAAEELVGRKEYIWYADPETDEDAKLMRVYRLGDLILEVDEVDDDPFASASSHRVPHRLQGLSIPEVLGDLQKLKTVLTRALVDGTMQANVPRYAARNGVNLDDLLNLDYGAVIRTGDLQPGEAVQPIFTPDLSQSTLKALEWTNQIIEQRSGVGRHAQGMDPDSLNHTAKGIQLLQNAANAVKRLLARLIAVGVEEMMMKVDRTIMRHQKSPRQVKIGKTWKRVDPRSWKPGMRVQVSVGLGTGAKEAQLAFLQMIQQDQIAWCGAYGLQTPVVTPKHLHATVSEKLRVMGYQSADKFFGEPGDFVPQPPPNPDQAKAQAELQKTQMELQHSGQMETMKVQAMQQQTMLQAQKDMEVANAQQRDEMVRVQMDGQNNERTAALETAKIQMQVQQASMEHERETQRMAAEHQIQVATLQLKARELDIKEQELRVRQAEAAAQRAEAQANREHQSEENKEDRKVAKAKPNGKPHV